MKRNSYRSVTAFLEEKKKKRIFFQLLEKAQNRDFYLRSRQGFLEDLFRKELFSTEIVYSSVSDIEKDIEFFLKTKIDSSSQTESIYDFLIQFFSFEILLSPKKETKRLIEKIFQDLSKTEIEKVFSLIQKISSSIKNEFPFIDRYLIFEQVRNQTPNRALKYFLFSISEIKLINFLEEFSKFFLNSSSKIDLSKISDAELERKLEDFLSSSATKERKIESFLNSFKSELNLKKFSLIRDALFLFDVLVKEENSKRKEFSAERDHTHLYQKCLLKAFSVFSDRFRATKLFNYSIEKKKLSIDLDLIKTDFSIEDEIKNFFESIKFLRSSDLIKRIEFYSSSKKIKDDVFFFDFERLESFFHSLNSDDEKDSELIKLQFSVKRDRFGKSAASEDLEFLIQLDVENDLLSRKRIQKLRRMIDFENSNQNLYFALFDQKAFQSERDRSIFLFSKSDFLNLIDQKKERRISTKAKKTLIRFLAWFENRYSAIEFLKLKRSLQAKSFRIFFKNETERRKAFQFLLSKNNFIVGLDFAKSKDEKYQLLKSLISKIAENENFVYKLSEFILILNRKDFRDLRRLLEERKREKEELFKTLTEVYFDHLDLSSVSVDQQVSRNNLYFFLIFLNEDELSEFDQLMIQYLFDSATEKEKKFLLSLTSGRFLIDQLTLKSSSRKEKTNLKEKTNRTKTLRIL